jgi:cytochrome c-type biogenesis protein CcmF
MTRSGVFNSVHSFTQSAIGPTILVFLAAALLFTIALLAFRIDKLENEGRLEGAASREAMFLVNNLLFVLLTFTVLIGTVFPLIVEAVKGKQMSVGRPFFDSMVVPIGAALLFLLGVGPALPWGRATGEQMRKSLLPPLIGAALFALIGFAAGVRSTWSLVTLAFGGYAAQVTIAQMFVPMMQRLKRGESVAGAFVDGQLRRGRRRFGSYIVHGAVVVVIVAIAVSSSMRQTTELTFVKGQTQKASGFDLTLLGVEERSEPHRVSTIARFAIARNGKPITTLEPRMSHYPRMTDPIGSPDVYTTPVRDLYISLANIDPVAQTATITVYESPMVVWIWIAVIIMGIGGLIALKVPA